MRRCVQEMVGRGLWNGFDGARGISAKSLRSKVERRMLKESGKTLREIRRAKKLITDEERLLHNLRRAYKKIGYRNRNYVPVGDRGVFGGVVQNMHIHGKFHETVQKLNIRKIEQELWRKGVNPDDPVSMASIQRVASTFFNAIDQKEGSPYAFQRDKKKEMKPSSDPQQSQSAEDSDQEELDRFIAEIEDAADKEWAAEKAAEKEEFGKIRYWNRIDASDDDGNISKDDAGWISNNSEDFTSYETDDNNSNKARDKFSGHKVARRKQDKISKTSRNLSFKRNENVKLYVEKTAADSDSDSDDMLSNLEDAVYEYDSDDREVQNVRKSRVPGIAVAKSSNNDADSSERIHASREGRMKEDNILRGNGTVVLGRHNASMSDMFSESDAEENLVSGTSRKVNNHRYNKEASELVKENMKSSGNNRKIENSEELDETWDSDFCR
ncbi:hypothetical protein ACH5RR_011029 [Cinchona calisaya]|uniref:CRM domain-containing protein n=1 Tax=Cinchona calisaya TaxID=153742 RepID=A0ABD3A581_9GENT